MNRHRILLRRKKTKKCENIIFKRMIKNGLKKLKKFE